MVRHACHPYGAVALMVAIILSISEGYLLPVRNGPFFGSTRFSTSSPISLLRMGIETIEYTIYPDGRIEETVRGVKGDNCHKITDEINQHLGEVVASQPTEEMFEEEIKIDQTVTDSVTGQSGDSWSSGSSW